MIYRWNIWQILAFACWLIGGLLVAIPAYKLVQDFRGVGDQVESANSLVIAIVIGVVILATGGTLHKIGSSREIK